MIPEGAIRGEQAGERELVISKGDSAAGRRERVRGGLTGTRLTECWGCCVSLLPSCLLLLLH